MLSASIAIAGDYKLTGFNVNQSTCLTWKKSACNLPRMKYGERLRAARKHAGLTQAGLADAVRNVISQQGVQYLETSDATGSEYTAQFADACKVSAMWLAEEHGEMVDQGVDPRLKAALNDPKLVKAMLLMEPLPGYAVDHVMKEIAETQELIDRAAQGKNTAA